MSNHSNIVGLWFTPSDEDLLTHYLHRKIHLGEDDFITEMDIYGAEPWLLHHVTNPFFKKHEWFYFVKRTSRSGKNCNGMRAKRMVCAKDKGGTWTAVDKGTAIYDHNNILIGYRQSLSFFEKDVEGKAKKGTRTEWLMKEYKLASPALQEWVLCRIYKKSSAAQTQRDSVSNEYGVSPHESATPSRESIMSGDLVQSQQPLLETPDSGFWVPNTDALQSGSTSNQETNELNIYEYGQNVAEDTGVLPSEFAGTVAGVLPSPYAGEMDWRISNGESIISQQLLQSEPVIGTHDWGQSTTIPSLDIAAVGADGEDWEGTDIEQILGWLD